MTKKIFIGLLLSFCGCACAAQKPLIVVLDWFVNPNHAPLFVAEQEGFFDEKGIKVKFLSPADTYEGEKMVATNQADIAVSYQPTLIYKRINNLPIEQFATLIDSPLSCVVVLKDGPIHTIKDLKGKRVGCSSMGSDHLKLTTMLKSAALTLNDIQLINVKFNLTQSLLSGKIDGFKGGMRNVEPIVMESVGKPARLFYPEDYGFPMYDELIFVTNKSNLHNPDLVKFTNALKKGVTYLRKNPKKCWQKFVKNHPELNNSFNEKSWFITIKYFAINPAKIDRNRYQKLEHFILKEDQAYNTVEKTK